MPEQKDKPLDEKALESDEDRTEQEFLQKARDLVAKRKESEKVEPDGPKVHQGPQVFKGDILIEGALCVRSADGKSSIQIAPMEGTAGIWVQSETKDDKYPRSSIAIYDNNDGPVIGFYRDIGEKDLAMTFAIGIDQKNGLPCLQVANGRGGFGSIGITELLDKAIPGWR